MTIISRHILKNMIAKPFRSVILFLCIAVCTFVVLVSVDIIGNLDFMGRNMVAQIFGTSDIVYDATAGVTKELELSKRAQQLIVYRREDGSAKLLEGMYNYYHKDSFSECYVDDAKANSMGLLPERLDLSKNEVAVTKRLKERNGWNKGDTIVLYDDVGETHKYVIVKVLEEIGLANGYYALFLSKEGYETLTPNMRAKEGFIDVFNDNEVKETYKEIKSKYYNITPNLILDSKENKEMMKSLAMILGLIFTVCLLMVVFVAISISSRIVCERMSVVGTLRSLGLSSGFTTKLLLVENAAYGLIASLLGSVLYATVRERIFSSIFSVSTSGVAVKVDYGKLDPIMILLVIVVFVILMCVCPLKEILKTSRIAIRDLIFDNQDTAYKYNTKTKIAGFVILATAIVTFVWKENIVMQFICFPSLILAVALLFPWILKFISKQLSKLFERINCPIAKLAANEIRSRKSTVGSSVLCVTISALSIIIFILVSTTGSIYNLDTYTCDVVATIQYQEKPEQYLYVDTIDGVKDTEFIYCKSNKINIGKEKREVNIFGLNEGGYKYVTGIKNCPKKLHNNEFVMDKALAAKLKLKVGNQVKVVFGEDSFMPMTKELTLVGFISSYGYDASANSMIVSKKLYVDIYHDYPGYLLVKCSNEKTVVDMLQKYSSASLENVKTVEQIKTEWAEKGAGTKRLLLAIIIFGISLSVIGMVSNQLIGFEGRKREFAVLASVAMRRGSIAKMLFMENILATAISLITAYPLALIAFVPFKNVLGDLSGAFEVTYDVKVHMIFLVVLFVVFSFITLLPMKELKKMKIAGQLKYE